MASLPLLRTKLYIPPIQRKLVSRQRLLERLNAGFRRKLTLISAPAGFGKTTLLSECVARCGWPVAWLSLDKGDNDPVLFWGYFITALQTIHGSIGESALAALRSPQPPPMEALLTSLINEIAEVPERFALILDDFHAITAEQIHDSVSFILDNLPPPMHLILSSRADPPWPLARLRARREMTELRAGDLRFTHQEAASFLNNVMQLNLSPEDVAALEDRTEGWIAGLQMAALSMQGRKLALGAHDVSGFVKAFTGSHRFVLDYLVEEVLNQQSSEIQQFLLKTSILERLTASLCDAVTDGNESQAILAQLDQANLFVIPLDDERRWYRYHHLFADLLRGRLAQAQPGQASALHRRASQWYEQNGLITEAVGHALAADDVERVARLVEGNAFATIYHGQLTTLVGWLDALPQELRRSRPWLCVSHAWVRSFAGQFDAVETLLQDAEKALVDMDEHGEEQRIVGHIVALRAYAVGIRGDLPQVAKLAREALQRLSEDDLMVRGFAGTLLGAALRLSGDFAAAAKVWTEVVAISQKADDRHGVVMALSALSALQIELGQLHKAAATCQEALRVADGYMKRGGRRSPVTGPVYARMSTLRREWNDLEVALRYARESLALSKRWGQAEGLTTSYLTLAQALQAIGHADTALDAVREARQVASNLSPWYRGRMAAYEVRLWLAQDNLSAAAGWAQESGLTVDDPVTFDRMPEYLAFARFLIAQGRRQGRGSLDEGLKLLAQLLGMAEAAGAKGYVIETLVLQAMALWAEGNADQALSALERALSLAEPEGYVRTFVDEGVPMAKLLRRAAAQGIALDYVNRLLVAYGESEFGSTGVQVPQPRAQPLIEPLSERELEVLRLLTTSLSSTDIAAELVISVSTVRSHIKNIYGKLNVHRRADAVQRAKDLGLF